MEAIAIVTIIAVLQAFWFAFEVGKQRAKHGIAAPACTGAPEFERMNRVHQNTVEQLVVVLPCLWIFGMYVHALIGAGLGLLFIIGRFMYRVAYVKDPKARSASFGIGAVVVAVLAIGGLLGAGKTLLGL